MKTHPYSGIATAICEAGFFVSGPHFYDDPECSWHRIIPTSKRRQGGGYTGNSFWISFDNGEWYIGTWGGWVYQIANPNDLATMSIEWMSQRPDGTYHDFEPWIIEKYRPTRISDDGFRPSRMWKG